MSDSAPNLTGATAAVLAGMSERHFRRLLKDGTGPAQAPNGTHPPDQFRDWLRGRWSEEVGVGSDGRPADSFQAERTRLTKAQADKAEIEAAELARELVRTEDVKLTWGELVAAVRAKLLSLPSKLAPLLAPPGKIAEAQALAETMVHEALSELAGSGLPANHARTRGPGAVDAGAAAKADGESVGGSLPAAVKRVKRGARKVEH